MLDRSARPRHGWKGIRAWGSNSIRAVGLSRKTSSGTHRARRGTLAQWMANKRVGDGDRIFAEPSNGKGRQCLIGNTCVAAALLLAKQVLSQVS